MATSKDPITLSEEEVANLKHAADQLELAAAQIAHIFPKVDASSDESGSMKMARMRCIRGKERIREALTVKKTTYVPPDIDDTDETGDNVETG